MAEESGENSPSLFIPESWPAMFDQVLTRFYYIFLLSQKSEFNPPLLKTSAEDFGIGSTPTVEDLPALPLELQAYKDSAKVTFPQKQIWESILTSIFGSEIVTTIKAQAINATTYSFSGIKH